MSDTSPKPQAVVFIHGLWIYGSSWDPWLDLFSARGYAPSAPGWPGDGDTVRSMGDHPDRTSTTSRS